MTGPVLALVSTVGTLKVKLVPTGALVRTVGSETIGGGGGGGGVAAWENSEVLLAGSVAVAVNDLPLASRAKLLVKRPLPVASSVMEVQPMKVWPWPKPDGSLVLLRKNSMR